MRLSTVYRRAAELIAPEGAWMQGGPTATSGARLCGGDAVLTAHHEMGLGWLKKREQAIATQFETGLVDFNDAPDTTQADVVTYLLLASEALRSEGK